MGTKSAHSSVSRLKAGFVALPTQLTILALTLRMFLFVAVWLSTRSLPPEWTSSGSQFLQSWSMWDGGHYIDIAEHGYLSEGRPQSTAAFFPLYPMVIRVVSWLPVVNVQLAGIVVSLASLLMAVWFFADYVLRHLGATLARQAVIVLLVTPYAVFLTAVYTESFFMMLAILGLWFADRKSWWAAALFCALATATRITGVALVPAVLYLAYRNRESIARICSLAVLSVSGLVAYMVYCWAAMDSPVAFLTAQSDWGGWQHRFGGFLEVFFTRPGEILTGEPHLAIGFINLVILIIAVASLPFVWRYLDHGMAIYSTLVVAQGALSLISLGRMMIPAFGIHIVVAIWLSGEGWGHTLRQAVVLSSTMLMVLFAVLFAQGRWIV